MRSITGRFDGPGVIRLEPARVGDGRQAQRQVGRCAAQGVAFGQQGGKGGRLGARQGQHMGETRMQGQGGQGAAMVGDAALVQRAKARSAAPAPRPAGRAAAGSERAGRHPPTAPAPAPARSDRPPRSRRGDRRPARPLRPGSTAGNRCRAATRPARPRRCSASARVTRSVTSRDMPELGSNLARRLRPPSTTTVMSGRVRLVSAIEVASTTRRPATGPKAARWAANSIAPNSGRTVQPGRPPQHPLNPPDFALTGQKGQKPALRHLLQRLPDQPGHRRLEPLAGDPARGRSQRVSTGKARPPR